MSNVSVSVAPNNLKTDQVKPIDEIQNQEQLVET